MYRTEIDGLRAFSVILIILYHLTVPGLHGAYVSVDVFFVISGFLISWILLEDMQQCRFSFRTFYYRRVTRIFPTLLASVALTMLAAAVVMTPADLAYAAKQGLAAIFSVSNIFYWQATGYWEPEAKTMLFLHTWTLGVEEQFYLFYPWLLWLAFRLGGRRGALALLCGLVLGGVLLTESLVRDHPDAAYYLMPLRFFEFAIGGLGSFAITGPGSGRWTERAAPAMSLAGAPLVIGSMVVMDRDTVFPGLTAVPVCVGTVLLILAGSRGVAAPVLRLPFLTWVGRASYSIYLVHWPIIVLYRYLAGPTISAPAVPVLGGAALVLGAIIYRGVDNAFRVRRGDLVGAGPSPARRVGVITAAGAAVVTLCVAMIAGKGWTWRVPDDMVYLAGRTPQNAWWDKKAVKDQQCLPAGEVFCGERRPGGPNILLLGDSLGTDLYIALRTAYPEANVYASVANGCPPVFDENVATHPRFPGCVELNRKRLSAALAAPPEDIIFMVTHLNGWREKYVLQTVERLTAAGKTVYLVGQTQFIRGQDLLTLAVRHGRTTGLDDIIQPYLVEHPFQLDGDYAAQVEGAGGHYIRNAGFFTDDLGGYRLYTANGNDLVMYDHVHLTLAGAREYGRYLAAHYPPETVFGG